MVDILKGQEWPLPLLPKRPCTHLFKCLNYLLRQHLVQALWGWSGGAMVLGNLPVPGRPTNLD